MTEEVRNVADVRDWATTVAIRVANDIVRPRQICRANYLNYRSDWVQYLYSTSMIRVL